MNSTKRILFGFIVLLLAMNILNLAVNFFEKKEYKYITFDNEWGISNSCFINKEQIAICNIDKKLIIVKQFYNDGKSGIE